MGDLVRRNTAGWKIALGVGLLLVSGIAAGVSADELGTADHPFRGPEVEGVRASQLVAVSSETIGDTALIQVVGDGSFEYAAFQLDDPARFVLDLPGVVKSTEASRFEIDHTVVAGVRVGQYRAWPDPVSRVVFDLVAPAVPRVEPMPEGLAVSFDAASLDAEFPPTPVAEEAVEVAEIVAQEPPVEADVSVDTDETVATALPAIAQTAEADTTEQEPAASYEPTAIADTTEIGEASPASAETTEMPSAGTDEPAAPLEPMPEPMPEPVTPEVGVEAAMSETVATEAVTTEQPTAERPAAVESEAPREPATRTEEPEPMPEPMVEPIVPEAETEAPAAPEPMVEPMIPAPTVTTPASADQALFDVANVQMEESTEASTADEAAASFQAQEVGTERRYQGEPMDLTLQDADVKDVLRSFAQLSGLNLVIQPGVSGTVTVELQQVPWDQALEQILKINDLGYELDGNIMRIAPISKLRAEAEEQQRLQAARALSVPLSTVIRRISYANSQQIARVLTTRGGVMSSRGQVIVDQRTNTLIIKELPSYMNTVIAIIENLDIPEPQVMIEARIIETTKRFSRSLGIAWGFSGVADAAHGNTTGLEFPNNGEVDGGVQLLTGGQNGFINLSLGNVLNTFNLDAALNAAESEGLINVLSAPRVATLNNERASIQSGLQIPIQTVANNTVSVQFVNATLRLDVTPQVTAEGTILMDINIQKREPQLAFAVVGATNAPIATKEARTRVIVRDGGTTVIGGIYEVSTDQGEDRVPGLSKVPVLKHLFKNRRRSDDNEELLIFITPRVTKL